MRFMAIVANPNRLAHNIFIVFAICITLNTSVYSNYYTSPVKHPIRLSGTFCELRSNHFHAGIDIRSSAGVSGDTIYNVADGQLSRVRVQRGSYGQVLYIDHNNGTTSVYAHLERFHPKIEKLVKAQQYKYESSEVDIYIDSITVNINKGDYIGIMGNTGRSFGPHLHFEIRDTASEEPINPFLYGFDVEDKVKPIILSAWVYALDRLGRIVSKQQVSIAKKSSGVLVGKVKHVKSTNVGIGVGAYDKVYQYKSYKGIYGATVSVASDTLCTYLNDRFNFNENKAINGLIDYAHYKQTGSRITKLFQMQHSSLSLFNDCATSRGIITLDSLQPTSIHVSIFDYNGNVQNIQLELDAVNSHPLDISKKITNGNTYVNGPISIQIEENTLFEDADFSVEKLGNTYRIGNENIPLNKPINVTISDPNLTDSSILVKKGTTKSFGGSVEDGLLYTSISELGDFIISEDKNPPTITTVRYSKERSKYSNWKFTIKDDFSDKVQNKKLQVKAEIDGEFIRSIFDSKSNSLTISDLDQIPHKATTLSIIATDIHNNVSNRDYPL